MSILAKGGNDDFPALPIGVAPAIACDVVDLGEQETPYKVEKGPKAGQTKFAHQIMIVFQVHPEDEDGNPIRRDDGKVHLMSKFYTLSLAEKANLRKDLDSWRGKPFTEEELKAGWDVESVIGAQCNLNIIANPKDPEKKRKIANVLPKGKRDPKLSLEEYVREMDRPGGRDVRSPEAEPDSKSGGKPAARQEEEQEDAFDDDDLPF